MLRAFGAVCRCTPVPCRWPGLVLSGTSLRTAPNRGAGENFSRENNQGNDLKVSIFDK